MNYTDSVPLTSEKKREKILTFWASVRGKTKPFLIGKELKTKDLHHTAAERGNRESNKTQPKTPDSLRQGAKGDVLQRNIDESLRILRDTSARFKRTISRPREPGIFEKQRGPIVEVFAFIDTNVLLHYSFFCDVDWAAALDEPEVVLVLAPVVLSELDDHKWSGSRREKARAKGVLKAIDKIELAAEAIGIRKGVSVMGIGHEPAEAVFARYRLQGGVNDDRLLASLLAFREERGSNHRVLLVTADAGLRVKARGQRIEVIAPADDLAIDDEPDETERRLSAANHELAAYKSAAPDLRLTIEGELFIECKVHLVREFDTQTRARLFAEWHSQYPQGRLPGLPRLPGFISAEDAEIDLVFGKYKKYLASVAIYCQPIPAKPGS